MYPCFTACIHYEAGFVRSANSLVYLRALDSFLAGAYVERKSGRGWIAGLRLWSGQPPLPLPLIGQPKEC